MNSSLYVIATLVKMKLYHAFIRTHHITSRKKVAILKAAVKHLEVSALLRSGGVPGLMYVHGPSLESVQSWVSIVHDLRYKDYQLAAAPAELPTSAMNSAGEDEFGSLKEVDTVRDMAAIMEAKGLLEWWRKAMGYVGE
jgi:hypothetical protein